MIPTFKNVEDYILFIGGYKDQSGKTILETSPISLARYDVKILDSFCQQIIAGTALTDKQSQLSIRLLEKYRRQMGNLNPMVLLPDTINNFRLGVRQIDRSKKAFIKDGKIILKFPFDPELINQIKKQHREGIGYWVFDRDMKEWHASITESNVNWVVTVSAKHTIQVDEELLNLFEKIVEVERIPYSIELVSSKEGLEITNAPDSLKEYINSNLGGFDTVNLHTLVDYSSVLGYTVSKELLNLVKSSVSELQYNLMVNRHSKVSKLDFSLDDILEYAKLNNRLPVYIYDSGLSNKSTAELIYITRGTDNISPKILVTRNPIMIGSRKLSWLASSEKVVVFE